MNPLVPLLVTVAALPRGPSALKVLDGFVAMEAARVPAYRAGLEAAGSGPPPPGYQAAVSRYAGPIWYRPRRFAELGAGERIELLRSPAWRAYVRGAARFAPADAPVARVALTPEELVRSPPAFVAGPRGGA